MSEVGSTEVDRAVSAARSSWARISDDRDGAPLLARPRQAGALGRRLARIAVAVVAILVAFTVVGMVMPVGIMGALLLMVLLVAAVAGLAVWPSDAAPAPPPPDKPVSYTHLTLPTKA